MVPRATFAPRRRVVFLIRGASLLVRCLSATVAPSLNPRALTCTQRPASALTASRRIGLSAA
eukprot:6671266-Prymnesium_polylepis.1